MATILCSPRDEKRFLLEANPLEETLAEKFLFNIILSPTHTLATLTCKHTLIADIFSPSYATLMWSIYYIPLYIYRYNIYSVCGVRTKKRTL